MISKKIVKKSVALKKQWDYNIACKEYCARRMGG
ncbi:hypothetical protein BJV38_001589 [Clostridium beijerinckii]|nr:hypothetical protein [Clostridium beijerinckii]NRT44746.1 hypothetical protein [Clostridium beijerinckii]NRZ21262.1 hypothetical protein [Clostridium beijerinckii]